MKVFKGTVSRDGLSTETIGVWFRPKQSAANLSLNLESRASKMYAVSNRGTVYVKWWVLEFGHFLKGQCHEMVVEVRPWSGSLALNKGSRTLFSV
jgi:hypothetical protein